MRPTPFASAILEYCNGLRAIGEDVRADEGTCPANVRRYLHAEWRRADALLKAWNAFITRGDPDRDRRHTDGRDPDTQGLVGCKDAIQFCSFCPKCGARRIDSQIGLERTPEEYVQRLVMVFREVRRVLRDDGTLWLNLGDSYNAAGRDGHGTREGADALQA